MLRYRVHCATKVFDARTLHNKSFNAAILAERVIKATCCDWLLATTKVEFARRTLHNKCFWTRAHLQQTSDWFNFRIGQTFVELVWITKDKRLASLRPAYIRQLLGVSRQIIRLLGVSRLMYARHYVPVCCVMGDAWRCSYHSRCLVCL